MSVAEMRILHRIEHIFKYIIKNNKFTEIPKVLFRSVLYQMFKRFTNRTISKRLFNGKQIFLYPRCNISTMFVYTEIPDREEIMLLRKLADHRTVLLDIGANVGSYSVMLMDKVKDVIAFEPHPSTAIRCKMNFLLNGYSEVKVNQLALSDVIGETNLLDNRESSTLNRITDDTNSSIRVAVSSLDHFIKTNEDSILRDDTFIVKVDVEGCEENVFRGGQEFFKNYSVKGVVFECLENAEQVFRILKNFGYQIKRISSNNFFAYRDGMRE